MKIAKIALILSALFVSGPSFADGVLSPAQIVNELYKPYLADPNAKSPNSLKLDCLEAILPYASTNLKRAINKEKLCGQHTHEICALDFDIIINAQDWQLSDFKLEAARQEKNLPVINANFLNIGARNVVSYYFVNEKGSWKIDEIEAVRFKKDGSIDTRYKLKKSLGEYSY